MMVQRLAAFLFALPLAAVLTSAPGQAQYYSSQSDASRNGVAVERLPPPGPNIDDNGDYVPTARRAGEVPPVVTRGSQWLPGSREPDERPLPSPGFATQPAATNADPDVIRPPKPIGSAPQAAPQPSPPAGAAALPPEDQPETGQPKELPANLKRQLVDYGTKEPAGTIIIDTPNTYLYLVLGGGKALRYGIGVGRDRARFEDEGLAGLVPAAGDDRSSALSAARDGGRPGQSARRARALSRAHALSHPWHQPALDHRLVRLVRLHPAAQRGYRGSL
jgi:lipoprotein-anchoring transpeptidase ErfK/SrfK